MRKLFLINLYHGRINSFLGCFLGHKPAMTVLYIFCKSFRLSSCRWPFCPISSGQWPGVLVKHPIYLLKKKKKRTKWFTAWQLSHRAGTAGEHPGKSTMPGIYFILESGGSALGSPSNKVIWGKGGRKGSRE